MWAVLFLLLHAAPPNLNRALLVTGRVDGQLRHGMGAPVALHTFIVGAHQVGEGQLYWETLDGSAKGIARLLWRNDDKDLALFYVEGDPRPTLWPISIAKKLPELGATVFWWVRGPGDVRMWFDGEYRGKDKDGFLVIDGVGYPGCSGGPVFNEAGELIGVIHAGTNYADPSLDWDADLAMRYRSAFRAVILAAPIVGGFPKEK